MRRIETQTERTLTGVSTSRHLSQRTAPPSHRAVLRLSFRELGAAHVLLFVSSPSAPHPHSSSSPSSLLLSSLSSSSSSSLISSSLSGYLSDRDQLMLFMLYLCVSAGMASQFSLGSGVCFTCLLQIYLTLRNHYIHTFYSGAFCIMKISWNTLH